MTSRPDAGDRGKPRRVYRLTVDGRNTLKGAARAALAKPLTGARPNELGIANLLLLSRSEAAAAVTEARKALADARKTQPPEDDEYPKNAVQLHRALLAAAEEQFYAELERLVQRTHPIRQKRYADDEAPRE